MTTLLTTAPLTTDDLLAMPKDGVKRWLIRGELRENRGESRENPRTIRNRFHTYTTGRIAQFLFEWSDAQPEPQGQVHAGEVGVRLPTQPETTVGIDVVYISAQLAARQTNQTTILDGIPTLAVEILSPNNTFEETSEKRELYLQVGIPIVWVIDPRARTVTAFRPDAKPQLFHDEQELTAEPHLPGFRVPVAKLFL